MSRMPITPEEHRTWRDIDVRAIEAEREARENLNTRLGQIRRRRNQEEQQARDDLTLQLSEIARRRNAERAGFLTSHGVTEFDMAVSTHVR